MTSARTLALFACALVLYVAYAVYAVRAFPSTAGAAPSAQHACMEDEPCWTWSMMGDLQRGVTVDGRRRIVDPCTFAYLDFRGRIDWSRTRHLQGDEHARRHGCDWRLYAPTAGGI